jgi:lipoprotein-anchoring transpeptidase ErfK/SrfK
MVRLFASVVVILTFAIYPAAAQTPAASAQAQKTAAPAAEEPDKMLGAQVGLDRAGYSPGVIDGKGGKNTESALEAFQQAQGLTPTGQIDSATASRLGPAFQNPLSTYAISAADVAGPFVKSIPEDMVKKADLPALTYTSVSEMLAERFHTSPAALARWNPGVKYREGEVIKVPNVEPFVPPAPKTTAGGGTTDATQAANRTDLVITVTDATKTLVVEDASGNVVFHAPVTVGSQNDPLPVGEWKVTGIDRNPSFNYNPDLFWDADPAHSKAKLAPGPNNPVGSIWIDLSKEHYGIHGTPEPSRIGYTESHGCIRLTNWDATRLAALVGPGTKVVLR